MTNGVLRRFRCLSGLPVVAVFFIVGWRVGVSGRRAGSSGRLKARYIGMSSGLLLASGTPASCSYCFF